MQIHRYEKFDVGMSVCNVAATKEEGLLCARYCTRLVQYMCTHSLFAKMSVRVIKPAKGENTFLFFSLSLIARMSKLKMVLGPSLQYTKNSCGIKHITI